MSTKRIIADQVMFALKGGYPDVAASIQQEDIYKRIEQIVNSMYALQQFAINLPNGDTIPNNLAIATYQDIPVVSYYSGKAKSTLPVMPITLPRNAGINEVRPVISTASERILGIPMIPLQAGQSYLLQADSLLNNLMGQLSYESNGKTIVYSSDITALGITKVDMKLVVFDMSQYSETDLLPIPSSAEDDIVKQLLEFFAPIQAEGGLVSNYAIPNNEKQ